MRHVQNMSSGSWVVTTASNPFFASSARIFFRFSLAISSWFITATSSGVMLPISRFSCRVKFFLMLKTRELTWLRYLLFVSLNVAKTAFSMASASSSVLT